MKRKHTILLGKKKEEVNIAAYHVIDKKRIL